MVIPDAFVADASFTIPWVFGDESNRASGEAWQAMKELQIVVHVPVLWLWELTNVLVRNEKRGRINSTQVSEFLRLVERLPIKVSPGDLPSVFANVPPVMRTHSLTAYDAAYLHLAKRSGLPLATLDDALAESARREGIALVDVT